MSVCSSVAFFVLSVFNKHNIIIQNRFTSYVYLQDVLYFTDTAEDGVEEDGVSFDTIGVSDVEIVILLIIDVSINVSSVWVCEYAVEVTSVAVVVCIENEVDGTEISVLVCCDAEGDSTDVVTVGMEDDT